jgi:hypothetical protein
MPDMKDATRDAGFQGATREDKRPSSPPPDGRDDRGRTGNPFPPGYPKYFTSEGHTRVELVTTEAESSGPSTITPSGSNSGSYTALRLEKCIRRLPA